MPPDHLDTHSDKLQALFWLGVAAGFGWLLYILAPILTPFLAGAVLAYICHPLVEKLTAHKIPRTLAVALIIVGLIGVLVALVLIVAPLIYKETQELVARTPGYVERITSTLFPWIKQQFGISIKVNSASITKMLSADQESVKILATKLLESARVGGVAVIGFLANILLLPVVMFYLLLDWKMITSRVERLVPRRHQERIARLTSQTDTVLSEFLRGQLSVMLLLAIFYSVALAIAGLEFALPIGIVTGLLVFIPYIGFGAGLILAVLTTLLQMQDWKLPAAVAVVYGLGQIIEGFFLTPRLVGERIGLHPVAVIFALLAFGQLFGFAGVLLALPASAVLLVGLRELQSEYFNSRFYSKP